jgi:diguanylate cyclase (GGDEF)-like protein
VSPLLSSPGRILQTVLFLALLVVAGIFGFFHAAVGQEIVFAVFYLLPVAGATWFVGRTAGIAMAGICGIVALGAELSSGRVYSQEWIPVFNSLVVCGFFIITAYALAHLRTALQHEARLAREDVLTSIPNLRSFHEIIPVRFRSAAGDRKPVTMGLVDLSDIGYINDRWGTQAGDHLLRVAAHALKELLRPDDLLFRVGGTTFAVVLLGIGDEEAQEYMERLRARMLVEMERYDRPVSIAIAAVSAERATGSGEELFERTGSLLRTIKLDRTPHPFRVVSDRFVA